MRVTKKINGETESSLLDDRQLRDKCVGRFEVLEKVKELLLIPEFESMTLKQVANYYEVNPHAIEMICVRNADELRSDGVCRKRTKDFLNSHPVRIEKTSYITTFIYSNGMDISMSNGGLKIFPRRAILRIGMLLRDSEIAKEIRTQLLNIEEKASDDIKITSIEEEEKLLNNIGKAYGTGDINELLMATMEYKAFQNRYIKQLENDNKGLAGQILEWSDRKKLSAGIRQLSAVTGVPFGNLWNELYKNLQYKYGICLKQRGDKPYIQHIKEPEWESVIKTFCAMCEAYGQSPTKMFQQTTPVGNLRE